MESAALVSKDTWQLITILDKLCLSSVANSIIPGTNTNVVSIVCLLGSWHAYVDTVDFTRASAHIVQEAKRGSAISSNGPRHA